MDIATRLAVPVVVSLSGLVGFLTIPVDEADSHRELQAMPIERREVLAENLERFDKLGPVEQASIRKLDAELGRLDPGDRSRYRDILRRYHLWVNGLTEDQRDRLARAESPEARFALASQFRRDGRGSATAARPRVAGIRTGDCGMFGPYEMARALQGWNRMTPAERADLIKSAGDRLVPGLRAHARTLKVPLARLPEADEAEFDALLTNDKDFSDLIVHRNIRDFVPKNIEKATRAADALKKIEHPYAEFLYFDRHPPASVTPARFEKFAAGCPPWLLATLDPLSPDDARNYLTIIYRVLYPAPTEIDSPGPAKGKGAEPSNPPVAGPRPKADPKASKAP